MLELRQKTSEISTFEKHFQIMIFRSQNKQIKRIIKSIYTPNFFSFSNFIVLHQFYKSFVIPTPNKVYNPLKCHFLKNDLKNLKNLKIDRLQTKHTIIYIRKLQCISLLRIIHTDIILFVGTGFPSPLIQYIANDEIKEFYKHTIYERCSIILSKWMVKILT